MSRARATALALVNWRGVFYERYLLDRHVTALEGANGAGKTTVMIAAYVVLLPDLGRLRFTNLGESGATGGDKGIWGRLGEAGRPSYAALEIEIADGERIVAGIHLERRAEPTLELSPFLISGVDLQGSLREVLLKSDGEHESVPLLDEVRAAVSARGGKLEAFSTTKDYFAALFERGVTPLRMATDEDRNKLNEMLRTSMTGGISRALTTELRAFLFKEETGLGDALSRMRGNLDACHRTRIEVSEARRLEHEIAGVYDAGQVMFAASVFATRAHADELERRVTEARSAVEAAEATARSLEAERAEADARHTSLVARVTGSRKEYDAARESAANAERMRDLAAKLAALEPEIAASTNAAHASSTALEQATSRREDLRAACSSARDAYGRAARGLADLQHGLDELHRRAHARQYARTQLQRARDLLAQPSLEPDSAASALAAVRSRLSEIDIDRARVEREISTAEVRRKEYARASAALREIAGEIQPADAHAEARRSLARLAELETLEASRGALAEELTRTLPLASRQRVVRARAEEMGLSFDASLPAARAVETRLAEMEASVREAEEKVRASETGAADARRTRDEALARLSELEEKSVRWREVDAVAARIRAVLGTDLRTRDDALRARTRVADERDAARTRLSELRLRRDAVLAQLATLEASQGAVHPDLLRFRDELDGELLAARFEDLPLEEASRVEAALGSLAEALVVEDPGSAAKGIAGQPREIDTVCLLPGGAYAGPPESVSVVGDDLVISEGGMVRVTRLKAQPSLGRRARERRATELRGEASSLDQELEEASKTLGAADSLARDTEALLPALDVLEAGDPLAEAPRVRETVHVAEAAEQAARGAALEARQRASKDRPQVDALRTLLGDAFLLEAPDHSARAKELEASLRRAAEARAELERVAGARAVLSELVETLRTPPEETAHAGTREALGREREILFGAREALEDVERARQELLFQSDDPPVPANAAIVPAVEAEVARTRDALQAGETALRDAEALWETAAVAHQKAQATLEAVRAHANRLRAEIAEGGGGDVVLAEAARDAAKRAVAALEVERAALETEERAAQTRVTLLEERRAQAARVVASLMSKLAYEEQAKTPASQSWQRARTDAETASVLSQAMSTRFAHTYRDRPSASLWPEVRSRADVLLERLEAARGGSEVAVVLRSTLGESREMQPVLDAWVSVRDWVKRRLPAQVADVPDPLEALGRLRDGLVVLEERLTRQEGDLRGASEDVARGIEVRLRKAKNQVKRLNQNLEGVSFGSIGGIRVQMKRVDRMDQVLRALREGVAQELLFQPNLPIEDALDEIFRRYGGGRGGGQRILDYREYVELSVEIRRASSQAGAEGAWELASPTRLSTGEAIGVGAALMMVILTEWERDANLLRTKRSSGSLRFLFLDEANRLSHDNLGVLFDLCKTLDLQLLIAAPEVARAAGNTTYRLVRRVLPEGGEEVLVSGRRTIAPGS